MLAVFSTLLALAGAPPETLVVPLKEVVVTGTRMPEEAIRIPAAISLVDRSRFERTRGISLKDALQGVPGVLVQSRAGAQDVRVTIRGFGARGNGERSNAGNMRGIRVLTDGIPITEPDGRTSLDLVDLGATDRVEIARSNASALYGNASGGVVNLRSRLSFDSPWVELRERAGSFGYHREQGIAGVALGQGRATVSLLNTTFEGWRDHSESNGTLGQIRFTGPLDEGTRLGLMFDMVSNLNRFPGALTKAQLDSAPQQSNAKYLARDERRRNRVGRVAATLERKINEAQDLSFTLFAEPKVLQRSERNRFRDFNRIHTGGNAAWQWVAKSESGWESRTSLGADEQFQDGSIEFHDLTPSGGRGLALIQNKREAANSAGGFAQEQLILNDRWSFTGAVRYDNLWYISEDFLDPTLNATKHFTRVTPKGSIARLADSWTLYASLGGGVEAPAFNEIDPPPPFDTLTTLNPFLEPMQSLTYEVGAKGQLPGTRYGNLQWDAAVYLIETKNEIVPFNGGAYFLTAGESRRKGVELGLDWTPTPPLLIGVSGTFSDNTYEDYSNDLGDFSGNDIPGIPATFYTVRARYGMPMGLSAELSVEGVGEMFADDANTAEAPAYSLLNGSIGFDHVVGSRLVRAYVGGHNLTDREHVASVFINGVSGEYYEAGLPRSWSAGLTVGLH